MHEDMTVTQVLRDPLIRLMMRADGVSFAEFAALLEEASIRRNKTFAATKSVGEGAYPPAHSATFAETRATGLEVR